MTHTLHVLAIGYGAATALLCWIGYQVGLRLDNALLRRYRPPYPPIGSRWLHRYADGSVSTFIVGRGFHGGLDLKTDFGSLYIDSPAAWEQAMADLNLTQEN